MATPDQEAFTELKVDTYKEDQRHRVVLTLFSTTLMLLAQTAWMHYLFGALLVATVVSLLWATAQRVIQEQSK